MDNEKQGCNLDTVRLRDLLSRNATRKGTATMDQTLKNNMDNRRRKGGKANGNGTNDART